jgi:hypothetical protein
MGEGEREREREGRSIFFVYFVHCTGRDERAPIMFSLLEEVHLFPRPSFCALLPSFYTPSSSHHYAPRLPSFCILLPPFLRPCSTDNPHNASSTFLLLIFFYKNFLYLVFPDRHFIFPSSENVEF